MSLQVFFDKHNNTIIASLFLSLIYFLAMVPYEFLSIDDAFFYFTTADKSANFFQTSYDTVTLTNGYQPLWMMICFLVQKALVTFNYEHAFLYVIITLNIIFLFSFLYVFRELLGDFGVEVGGAWHFRYLVFLTGPVIFFHPSITPFEVSGGGIEFQLTLLLFCLWLRQAKDPTSLSSLRFALLTAALVFSRLDSAVIIAPYFLFHSVKESGGRVFLSGVIAAIVIGMWLYFNFVNYGSIVPISGQVKSLWGEFNTNAGSMTDRVKDSIFLWVPLNRMLFGSEYILSSIRILKTCCFALFVCGLSIAVLKSKTLRSRLLSILTGHHSLVSLLCVGFIFFLGYLASHGFTETKFWYYSFLYIFFGLIACTVLFSNGSAPRWINSALIGYCVLSIMQFFSHGVIAPVTNEYARKSDVLYQAEVAAAGAVIATPNSGYFGWKATLPLRNMDGLMGDQEYLDVLRKNAVADYWGTKDVAVLIPDAYLEKWPYQHLSEVLRCAALGDDEVFTICVRRDPSASPDEL